MSVSFESKTEHQLMELAECGNTDALATMYERIRERLERLVSIRIDPRLRRRVSSADIVQETFLTVQQKFATRYDRDKLPFYLWVRLEIGQKLIEIHRHHFGTQMRDATRDVSIYLGGMPTVGSAFLTERLIGQLSTASQAAIRAELSERVQEALDSMKWKDRKMLVLRHFEELTNSEAAVILGIAPTAASNRYIRALERLRVVFQQMPGGVEGIWP